MKNRNAIITTMVLALSFFALLPAPKAFGISPPPDGCYPNFTTAEGCDALSLLTTGAGNTGLGWRSLFLDTTGSFNTGVGGGALALNNGDSNSAVGAAALLLNTTGTENTAVGTDSLVFNDTGSQNTALGAFALFSNTATGNTAVGARALLNNTTGGTLENIQGTDVGPNVAVGEQALESNTVASANTAVGYQALHSFMTGPTGFEPLGVCTAVGFQALANATGAGVANNAFGYQALMNDTDGANNTAIGYDALFSNTTGNSNVALGNRALRNNAAGNDNTAIGLLALGNNTTGGGNVALGLVAGFSVVSASNVICIGNNVQGANVSNSCYIGNISGAASPGGIGVFVNSDGKLGTNGSSRRFKDGIKPMDKASTAILALQPVTFRYKKEFDPTGIAQFGLVAEESRR